MYEIELKAHVRDCGAVRRNLAQFATYVERVRKDDRYYRRPDAEETDTPSVRIRTERAASAEGKETVRHVLTYKRKQRRGRIEVNEELESLLENPAALDTFLQDSGHAVYLRKRKESEFYTVSGGTGRTHIELCDVPPLGWFIEIEILCEENSGATIARAQAELRALLSRCGIADSEIEPRYYSELLQGIQPAR